MPSTYEIPDVIAQVNMARMAFGADLISELPDATIGAPAACLFYRALADLGCRGVHGNAIKFANDRQAAIVAAVWGTNAVGSVVLPPDQMNAVIGKFDHREYEHYFAVD